MMNLALKEGGFKIKIKIIFSTCEMHNCNNNCSKLNLKSRDLKRLDINRINQYHKHISFIHSDWRLAGKMKERGIGGKWR